VSSTLGSYRHVQGRRAYLGKVAWWFAARHDRRFSCEHRSPFVEVDWQGLHGLLVRHSLHSLQPVHASSESHATCDVFVIAPAIARRHWGTGRHSTGDTARNTSWCSSP
jgi:hypothetical protein